MKKDCYYWNWCDILLTGDSMNLQIKKISCCILVMMFSMFIILPVKAEMIDYKSATACQRANCEREGDKLNTESCNDKGIEACESEKKSEPDDSITMCGTSIKMDSRIPKFVSNIYNLLKIVTPIVLILFGMLDFAKATMNSDASALNKAGKKFVNRLIAGAAVFFVFIIVQFSVQLLAQAGAGSTMDCANCLLNNQCK